MSVKYYTVVSGDTLWGISRKFGVTVDQLCSMNGITVNTIIHPGQRLIVGSNGGQSPDPTPNPSPNQKNLDAVISWFRTRQGKVTYDMYNRLGPYSYDCSSAVFSALIAGGFLPVGTPLGSTESLYQLEGTLLIPISRSEARYGDIFVAGVKGLSQFEDGHTGVFVGNERIIHCVGARNGIAETQLEGWYGAGLPLYCYRLRGGQNSTPQPQPDPKPNPGTGTAETLVTSYAESGRFTANQTVNIHNQYSKTSAVAATLYAGESVTYDSVYITNKFVWISYISFSGVRRYVPIRTYNNGVKGPILGTIV